MSTKALQLIESEPNPFLRRAYALTRVSPSVEVYDLIADAWGHPERPGNLLRVISDRTNIDLFDVEFAEDHLAQVSRYKVTADCVRLALDATVEHYGRGLHLRAGSGGTLWRFDGVHWGVFSLEALRRHLVKIALEHPERYGGPPNAVAREAAQLIYSMAPDAAGLLMAPPRHVFNTPTAELWLDQDGRIEPRVHRPESRLMHVLGTRFDPKAECPEFDKALIAIFSQSSDPGALADLFVELMAYAAQPVRHLPTILFLRGGGANGKSTLGNVLEAVIGEANVHSGSLGALTADSFLAPSLAGKLVFLEHDARDGVRLDGGQLKKYSENTLVHTRPVRAKVAMSFRSTMMPVVALNGVPQLGDSSEGIVRRILVVPFDRRFTEDERDPTIAQRIIEAELPGVLNRILGAFERLVARGKFSEHPDCVRAKASFLSAADPLLGFMGDRTRANPSGKVHLSDIWLAFVDYVREQGQRTPFSRNILKSRLGLHGYNVTKSGKSVVQGLELLPRQPE